MVSVSGRLQLDLSAGGATEQKEQGQGAEGKKVPRDETQADPFTCLCGERVPLNMCTVSGLGPHVPLSFSYLFRVDIFIGTALLPVERGREWRKAGDAVS